MALAAQRPAAPPPCNPNLRTYFHLVDFELQIVKVWSPTVLTASPTLLDTIPPLPSLPSFFSLSSHSTPPLQPTLTFYPFVVLGGVSGTSPCSALSNNASSSSSLTSSLDIATTRPTTTTLPFLTQPPSEHSPSTYPTAFFYSPVFAPYPTDLRRVPPII